MLRIQLSLFILSFLHILGQAQIIENYGDLNGQACNTSYIEAVSIGDTHYVYSFWKDIGSEVYILDEEGNLFNTLFFPDDSSSYIPSLYTTEDELILMGWETPQPFSFNPSDIRKRHWKVQSYSKSGEFKQEISKQVLSNDYGFLSSSTRIGVNVNVVLRNALTRVGDANDRYAAQYLETIYIDSITRDPSPGPSFLYYLDRQSGVIQGQLLDTTIVSLSHLLINDDKLRFGAIRGADANSITQIHEYDPLTGELTSVVEPNIYLPFGLPLYAVKDGNTIYELKVNAVGPAQQNMGDLILTTKDSDNTIQEQVTLANNRAPFGKNSITLGNNNELFILSVDVINKSPLRQELSCLNKDLLDVNWNIEIDQNIFGLVQNLVPSNDGGCIVFGFVGINGDDIVRVTKIGPNGKVTNVNHLGRSLTQINAYPNPSSQGWRLDELPPNTAVIKIFGLDGMLVYSNSEYHGEQLQPMLSSGTYILNSYDKNHVINGSVILMQK